MNFDENICLFSPPQKGNADWLQIVNTVLETNFSVSTYSFLSLYRMVLVVEGTGVFCTAQKEVQLKAGDLFFILPSLPYRVESTDELKCMYLSFFGPKAERLIDEAKIGSLRFHFRGFFEAIPMFSSLFSLSQSACALGGEGLLCYLFAKLLPQEEKTSAKTETRRKQMETIRNYLDEHYAESDLTLSSTAEVFRYAPKYLSGLFKREMNIGFSEYVNTLRVRKACALMEQGLRSVQDVAHLCGYEDPLYFSRVFRSWLGCSPRAWAEQLDTKKK